MRNDTPSQVIVSFKNLDHSHKFKEALDRFFKHASMGGDCELAFQNEDADHWCGLIGHDVYGKVEIIIDGKNETI